MLTKPEAHKKEISVAAYEFDLLKQSHKRIYPDPEKREESSTRRLLTSGLNSYEINTHNKPNDKFSDSLNQILESYIAPPVSRVYSKIAFNSSLNFQYYFIFSIIIIIHTVFVEYEWFVDVLFLNGQNLRTTLHEKKLQPILLYSLKKILIK
ncbi:hypothetical protein GQX74_011788 [Glossina fuscipes]|nr:hypothetical protein GQX74_011788 [Glossina fuscipes]